MTRVIPILHVLFGDGYESRNGEQCCLNLFCTSTETKYEKQMCMNVQLSCGTKYHNKQDHLILRALRVEVVLCDPSRDSPLYLGEWHLFLPSDVFLGKYVNASDSRCSLFFPCYLLFTVASCDDATGSLLSTTMTGTCSKLVFWERMVYLGFTGSIVPLSTPEINNKDHKPVNQT